MPPRVSVLLPTYNRAALLPRAIESVLAQTMPDLELIIGDNVSTDETAEIVRRYAGQDARVRVFRNTAHTNAVDNFNLTYRRADKASAYLAVLASDDWWEPVLLERMIGEAEAHPAVTFVHTDMYRTDHDGAILNRYTDLFDHLPPPGMHQGARELFHGNYINIMSALMRRTAFQKVFPNDLFLDPQLNWAPDYLLWLQLLLKGAQAYYIPEPLAYYRKSKDAMTQASNEAQRLQNEVVIFRDKLAGICPPELETLRRETLYQRLVALGFALLQARNAKAARDALGEAQRLGRRQRLDVLVAQIVASLPCSTTLRANLWQRALATSHALRRAA
jgi:glycosyltransferase involved in cell wall biosynthesis